MRLRATPLNGVFVVEPELAEDERGGFARTYSRETFAAHGLDPHIEQCSTSFNRVAGTLRGLHYQSEPYAETKLVRVTRGAIYDVALDLRPDSGTYLRWYAVDLTADNRLAFYIPCGCAHGFMTRTDATEVFYQVGTTYRPEAGRGVRWNDPTFAIRWPLEHPVAIAERDRNYPDYRP